MQKNVHIQQKKALRHSKQAKGDSEGAGEIH